MQLRPTFCLWMEPGEATGIETFRERWRQESFAGSEHVFVEPLEAFLQAPDEEWHQRIRHTLSDTGDQIFGLAICHVWNLAHAPEGFFDVCIENLVKLHGRLDDFLRLNSTLYPQLQNRLCQLVIRLPLQGQQGERHSWVQRIARIQQARMPLSRVVVVGNSNIDPQCHEKGVNVRDEEIDVHLQETLLCLLESRVDRLLSEREAGGNLPFWSAGSARIAMDLKNASSFLAHKHGAELLREQLREDGNVERRDPEKVATTFELEPEKVLWRLLEGPDPYRSNCLKELRSLQIPPMDPQALEEPDGLDLPAAYMTQGMMEISEKLGAAYDQMTEHRQQASVQYSRRLFDWVREDMQGGQSLYWLQIRHRLERIQDANWQAKGAYPQVVENVFSNVKGEQGDSKSRELLDQVLPLAETRRAENPEPDPFVAYRKLRHRVQERKWAPSHLARWVLGFLPAAMAVGIGGGEFLDLPWMLQAGAGLGVLLAGFLMGSYLLYREKSLREKSLWNFRESLRLFARQRLKTLLKTQGDLFYETLHHVLGEPEETASRVEIDPEKTFGRHAQNPEMKPVIDMDFYRRLAAVKSLMESTAERIGAEEWKALSNRWMLSFFDGDGLLAFPFLATPAEGKWVLDPARSPEKQAQLSLCLQPQKEEGAGPWSRLWENLEQGEYERNWVKQVQAQGFLYFDKLSLSDFVDFLHAQDASRTQKAADFLRQTAHPYFRLAIGGPQWVSAYAVLPSDEKMLQSEAVKTLLDGYDQKLPAWDGLPGIVCMRIEGPITDQMHPLPIAHVNVLSESATPESSGPISFI